MSTCSCEAGKPCRFNPNRRAPCPTTPMADYMGEPMDTWVVKCRLTDGSKVRFELLFPPGTTHAEIIDGAMEHLEGSMRLAPDRVFKFSCERT